MNIFLFGTISFFVTTLYIFWLFLALYLSIEKGYNKLSYFLLALWLATGIWATFIYITLFVGRAM